MSNGKKRGRKPDLTLLNTFPLAKAAKINCQFRLRHVKGFFIEKHTGTSQFHTRPGFYF